MNSEGQEFYKESGSDYWWIKGKYNILLDLIKKFCKNNVQPINTQARIIDIGSGPGNLASILSDFGDYYANDVSPDAILELGKKGLSIVEGDAAQGGLKAKAEYFSLVVMVDALEHMKDDFAGLVEIYRILQHGGKLIIMVPAHMSLWGAHDEKYGHYRRYNLKGLNDILLKAGYKVEKISYMHTLFFPAMYLWRKIKRHSGSSADDLIKLPIFVNKFLGALVSSERFFLRRFNSRIGASVLAIAVKE